MVVFDRLSRRRRSASKGARYRAKTKRMLPERLEQVTVSGSEIRLQLEM